LTTKASNTSIAQSLTFTQSSELIVREGGVGASSFRNFDQQSVAAFVAAMGWPRRSFVWITRLGDCHVASNAGRIEGCGDMVFAGFGNKSA